MVLLKYLGIFQPYDIGFQQLFKLSVNKSASKFFENHIVKSMALKVTIQMPRNLIPFWNATPQ